MVSFLLRESQLTEQTTNHNFPKDQNLKTKRNRYVTTGEVAQVFEVSATAVKKWIQQGKLRAVRTPGGHFRITTQEFQRFRKAHGF